MVWSKKATYSVIIALCFLTYANSLHNEFVSDDIPSIVQKQFISSPAKYWLVPSLFINNLCYLVVGDNPLLYHLVNLILHSINTILVYFFLSLFFKSEASILGASLFAVHPIHVEAVAWVSGEVYTIMTLFILSLFFLYYRATGENRSERKINLKYYLICLIGFSYYIVDNFPQCVFLPFFLILFDFVFKRWRRVWKLWLPFLIITILKLILARGSISGRVFSVAEEMGIKPAWTNPIFNMTYSLFSHFGLLLWPARLTLYHEPAVISPTLLGIGIIALVLLFISLPFIFKKAKVLFFGIGIFILFLAPTYSPLIISWLLAERYVYFPSIMLSIFLAYFWERHISNLKRFKEIGFALCIFIIASYLVRAVARNEDWKTPERLWRSTVRVSPDSPRAHNNMGDVYVNEGNVDGAIGEFKKAVELKPDYADAFHNLANTYHRTGNLREAVAFYQQAITLKPNLFESQLNLGVIYLNRKEYDLAAGYFRKALKIRPDDKNAQTGLDLALQRQ